MVQKSIAVLALVFFAGCAHSTMPWRSGIQIGMTRDEVWKLYGADVNDPKSMTKNYPKFVTISEQQTENCWIETNRYWLKDSSFDGKPTPFLLTFERCRLPNYERVEEEKQEVLAAFRADPRFVKYRRAWYEKAGGEKALSQKGLLDTLDMVLIVGLSDKLNDFEYTFPFEQNVTAPKLIKIQLDQASLSYAMPRKKPASLAPSYDVHYGFEIDAYGPGIHKNKYSQPVTLWPDWGGIEGERLQIKEDAYGLGVHSDQYGRPVREYPWP